ncbi:putative septum site-determining protein MinD [Hibiscus syriacus]|uniref:Septum site-determining protein MinD n=1 Tax=Hibiscus syriacus TaxID=106335 RepID=A0A6A3BV03_HIBSY|nr:putative septum site-determining protein MinD [Hibiscus syriacus]
MLSLQLFPSNPNPTLLNPSFQPLLNTQTLNPPKPYQKSRHAPISSVLQWNRKPELAGETPRVVVITSGKGGVGKTTTTANVGLSLARLGFFVVAIDADVGLRNLDLLLGLENRVNYTVVEVLNGDCRLDQALVRDKRWSNFELLCISKPRSKLPIGFGGKALVWLVDALKAREDKSPDFILIDWVIPEDSEVIRSTNRGYPLVLNKPPTLAGLAFEQAAWRLVEQDSMKAVMVEEEPKKRGFFSFFGG